MGMKPDKTSSSSTSKSKNNTSINNAGKFSKSGMVPGALLPYLTQPKVPKVEPEINTRDVNEIGEIGRQLLRRCESPEIVYLGTYPISGVDNETENIENNNHSIDTNTSSLVADHNNSPPASSSVLTTINPNNNSPHISVAQDINSVIIIKSTVDSEDKTDNINTSSTDDECEIELSAKGESSSSLVRKVKFNFVTPTQKKKTEEKENSLRLVQQSSSIDDCKETSSSNLPTTPTNPCPSNNSHSSLKMNVQKSQASVVLPNLGKISSQETTKSPCLNVTDYYKPQKRKNAVFNKNNDSKKQKLADIAISNNIPTSSTSKRRSQIEASAITKRRRSSSESSSSKGKEIIYRSHEPTPMPKKMEEEFSLLMKKKKFKDALIKLSEKLDGENIMYPNAEMLAEIIENCILGRASRDMHTVACDYFEKLVQKLPLNADAYKLYVNTLTSVDLNPKRQLVKELLSVMKQDFKMKHEEKFTLKFFKSLTLLMEKEFNDYNKKAVKIHQPLIVVMMSKQNSSDHQADFNDHWEDFITTVTTWPAQNEETQLCIQWISIIGKYFESFKTKNWSNGYQTLSNFLIEKIIERNDEDYGLKFIKLLNTESLVLEVCGEIIQGKLPPFDDNQKWNNILYELSANVSLPPNSSRVIADDVNVGPLTVECQDKFSKFITEKINIKGESRLHLACGQKKSFNYGGHTLQYAEIFSKMKSTKSGDINIRDNAKNTPLHEACFHGCSDVLSHIWQSFTDDEEESGPQKVDLLAQNHMGETALHNAVRRGHNNCVSLLILMSQVVHCQPDMLRLRNNDKRTAYNLIPNDENEENEEMRNSLSPPSETGRKRRTIYAGVQLPETAIDEIESNMMLKHLIVCWRQAYDDCHRQVNKTKDS